MKLRVVWIAAKSKSKEPAYDALTHEYARRIARFKTLELTPVATERGLLEMIGKNAQRTRPLLTLLDSRGKEMNSEQFAGWLDTQQSRDVQQIVLAIGPADGFSEAARRAASTMLSLSKMTLPHELARVVLLEQIYRAFTIIRKHPYHCGH